MFAPLLALAAIVGGPVPAPPIHYRIDVKSHQELDLSAVGQPSQVTDLTLAGFLTLTLTDTAGGQIANVVIDSIALPPGATLPAQIGVTLESAAGISYHTFIVQGKPRGDVIPSRQNPLAAIFNGAVENLFPGIRAGSKMGDTWTDTTSASPSDQGLSRTTTNMTVWKVSAADGTSVTIEGTSTGTIIGQVPSGAGPLDMKGTITGTRKATGAVGGPVTSATIQAKQTATLSNTALPAPLPLSSTTDVTIATIH
jgi:hypothetical protein